MSSKINWGNSVQVFAWLVVFGASIGAAVGVGFWVFHSLVSLAR